MGIGSDMVAVVVAAAADGVEQDSSLIAAFALGVLTRARTRTHKAV